MKQKIVYEDLDELCDEGPGPSPADKMCKHCGNAEITVAAMVAINDFAEDWYGCEYCWQEVPEAKKR